MRATTGYPWIAAALGSALTIGTLAGSAAIALGRGRQAGNPTMTHETMTYERAAQPASDHIDLRRYRDRNRLLLIFAPNVVDHRYAEQAKLLHAAHEGFAERDLLRFDLFEQGEGRQGETRFPAVEAARLRAHFGIKPGHFAALLIGKDGHVANRADHLIAPERLYSLIDAMPMRRDEMRRKQG